MKPVEVRKELLGRPISKVALDLEKRQPSIPDGSITSSMLSGNAKATIDLPVGIYGTGKYGRCRYRTRPGIYGHDRYGSCHYYI